MHKIIAPLLAVLALFSATATWAAPPTEAEIQQRISLRQMMAESMLQDIGQATTIDEGSGAGPIYIFFDPNCPYCHQLYLNTRDWVKDGKAQLRWVPVGILTATSRGKATAILGADDPLQAFHANEQHYERGSGGGGIDEDIPDPAIDAKLQANLALLARTRSGAVPAMLFRTKDGAPILIQGSPRKDKLPVILENLGDAHAN